MSYSIYIGEAVIGEIDPDELKDGYNHLRLEVEEVSLPDAPSFPGDVMTGNSNGRHPAYAGWDRFCKATGLHKLFFDSKNGLMREHPGCFVLTEKDAEDVKKAREKWQREHPKSKSGWCLCGETEACGHPLRGERPKHVDLDGDLARLLWLEWWMKWALKNCKIPAIHNH